jgi:hypothetical protein
MQRTDPAGYPYFQYLEDSNELSGGGVITWRFYPGMTYGSREKWWPDTGERPTAHEGLDICYYTDSSGRDRQFTPDIKIPVMKAGTVLATCDDFLGRSVFLAHHAELLISAYAHIVPRSFIIPGLTVSAGEVIGTVADTAGRKNKMPVHLHITIMKAQAALAGVQLDWEYICNAGRATLMDPLEMLFCPYRRILPKIEG